MQKNQENNNWRSL